jgi:hypothetical protein
VNEQTTLTMMSLWKFAELFGASQVDCKRLVEQGIPHFDVNGNLIVNIEEAYAWMKERFYRGSTKREG